MTVARWGRIRLTKPRARGGRAASGLDAQRLPRKLSAFLRRCVDDIGELTICERSRGVLIDPTDPDSLDGRFLDDACADHSEFPVEMSSTS